MGCGAVSYSNVTIHTPETSIVSIVQLSISGDLEVYCDVSAEVDVEVLEAWLDKMEITTLWGLCSTLLRTP